VEVIYTLHETHFRSWSFSLLDVSYPRSSRDVRLSVVVLPSLQRKRDLPVVGGGRIEALLTICSIMKLSEGSIQAIGDQGNYSTLWVSWCAAKYRRIRQIHQAAFLVSDRRHVNTPRGEGLIGWCKSPAHQNKRPSQPREILAAIGSIDQKIKLCRRQGGEDPDWRVLQAAKKTNGRNSI
jgi:hypothetical protein